jgi:hypothetical protein
MMTQFYKRDNILVPAPMEANPFLKAKLKPLGITEMKMLTE